MRSPVIDSQSERAARTSTPSAFQEMAVGKSADPGFRRITACLPSPADCCQGLQLRQPFQTSTGPSTLSFDSSFRLRMPPTLQVGGNRGVGDYALRIRIRQAGVLFYRLV